ncbi:MAG TPA: DNA starvation/stationary phase protection protein Dps [Planctomycetota bacterium]|nr:DNA starvation/stationary phase protection protein Dps [Planctomycetota bacterium]
MTFKTKNDLPAKAREEMIALCNRQLADTFDLMSQVKQAHWNVKGPQFFPLHELFDKLAEEVEDSVDTIAERATALGGVASGTVRMAAKASRLPELPADTFDGMAVVDALVARYAALAASTRAGIAEANEKGDFDTADVFTEVSRELDKSLWFLEAHRQS